MAPAKDPAEASWHFDRRIPIALIVTIAIQTFGIVWWASWANSQIVTGQATDANLASADVALAERLKDVEGANNDVNVRLARFEVLLESATDQLKEQRSLLTQIRDSVGPPKK
jgi:hypothetical protein